MYRLYDEGEVATQFIHQVPRRTSVMFPWAEVRRLLRLGSTNKNRLNNNSTHTTTERHDLCKVSKIKLLLDE